MNNVGYKKNKANQINNAPIAIVPLEIKNLDMISTSTCQLIIRLQI